MPRYYYYFHPAYTYYLDALRAFLNACGGISRELALLSELSATEDCYGIIHPEQIAEARRPEGIHQDEEEGIQVQG